MISNDKSKFVVGYYHHNLIEGESKRILTQHESRRVFDNGRNSGEVRTLDELAPGRLDTALTTSGVRRKVGNPWS